MIGHMLRVRPGVWPEGGRFVCRRCGAWTGRFGGAGVRTFFATARAMVPEPFGPLSNVATCTFFVVQIA